MSLEQHRELVKETFKYLNTQDVKYVILRSYDSLPQAGDTDVDMLYSSDDQEKIDNWFGRPELFNKLPESKSLGQGEHCEMTYHVFRTPFPDTPEIPNGCFQFDTYNSLYFKTNGHIHYTIGKAYEERVFDNRELHANGFYVPKYEDRIVLIMCRAMFDLNNEWKPKYIEQMYRHLDKLDEQYLIESLEYPFGKHAESISIFVRNRSHNKIREFYLSDGRTT